MRFNILSTSQLVHKYIAILILKNIWNTFVLYNIDKKNEISILITKFNIICVVSHAGCT